MAATATQPQMDARTEARRHEIDRLEREAEELAADADAASAPAEEPRARPWLLGVSGATAAAAAGLALAPSSRWSLPLAERAEAVDARPVLALVLALGPLAVVAMGALGHRSPARRRAGWVVVVVVGALAIAAAARTIAVRTDAPLTFVRTSATVATWALAAVGVVQCALVLLSAALTTRRAVRVIALVGVVAVAVAVGVGALAAERPTLDLAAPASPGARLLNPRAEDVFATARPLTDVVYDADQLAATDTGALVSSSFLGELDVVEVDGRLYRDAVVLADTGPYGLAGHLTDDQLDGVGGFVAGLARAPEGVWVGVGGAVIELPARGRGRLVAATTGDRTAASVAALRDRGVSLVPGRDVRAIASSPDGRLALLTADAVTVVRPGRVEAERSHVLPEATADDDDVFPAMALAADGTLAVVRGCRLLVVAPDGAVDERAGAPGPCEGQPSVAALDDQIWVLDPPGRQLVPLPAPGASLPEGFWGPGDGAVAPGPDGQLLVASGTSLWAVDPGASGVRW